MFTSFVAGLFIGGSLALVFFAALLSGVRSDAEMLMHELGTRLGLPPHAKSWEVLEAFEKLPLPKLRVLRR